MKFKKLIPNVILFIIILISGCAPKIRPTDICHYNIPVSQLYSKEDFDYVDFFDISIDIAKESGFQPPMKYDKKLGLIVFGHEDVNTMPGLKMVVYMWVDNRSSGTVDNICINYQIIKVKGTLLAEGMATEAILNFKNRLEQKYFERIETIKRVYNKYQKN